MIIEINDGSLVSQRNSGSFFHWMEFPRGGADASWYTRAWNLVFLLRPHSGCWGSWGISLGRVRETWPSPFSVALDSLEGIFWGVGTLIFFPPSIENTVLGGLEGVLVLEESSNIPISTLGDFPLGTWRLGRLEIFPSGPLHPRDPPRSPTWSRMRFEGVYYPHTEKNHKVWA